MKAEFQNRQDYFTLTLLPNKMDAAQARTFFFQNLVIQTK